MHTREGYALSRRRRLLREYAQDDSVATNRADSVEIVVPDPCSPSLVAFNVMRPAAPALDRTITNASPLNAFRSLAWNGSKLVASPLSTAAISPGPSI